MAIDESRSFKPVRIALLTVSDTRTLADDTSGDILAGRIAAELWSGLAQGSNLPACERGWQAVEVCTPITR